CSRVWRVWYRSTYAQRRQINNINYPRPLHPGGLALPPLVEDRLSIVTYLPAPSSSGANAVAVEGRSTTSGARLGGGRRPSSSSSSSSSRTDLLLVKPPDMESLWEWYAYTARRTDADPSWGRVWPTALSLSRWVLRAMYRDDDDDDDDDGGGGGTSSSTSSTSSVSSLIARATRAVRTSSHAVELGCGLGVAGLAYASSSSSSSSTSASPAERRRPGLRTITFLDREPHALHCVMSSAAVNGHATGPIIAPLESSESTTTTTATAATTDVFTVRAAVDDWTIPATTTAGGDGASSMTKNVGYRDLHLGDYQGAMLLLASDVLYEPSSMESLSNKLLSLAHPIHGGYALIADPLRERTPGCRDSFVECAKNSGGLVEIVPMPDFEEERRKMGGDDDHRGLTPSLGCESDVDIDGNLAKTVLIVVHYPRGKNESL
ncbi:hypothetical protein ACHAW5_007071, partial [Stephanodiscus triporus]